MILLFIVVGLISLSATLGYMNTPYDRGDGLLTGLITGGAVFGSIFLISQIVGQAINTHDIPEHHTTQIVSMADGSQVHGEFNGGLFLGRGVINETEYFSYYKSNGDGTYSIDKQLASLSAVAPDATPERARLESDSHIIHCETKWWSAWCPADSGVYDHGVFHVPANSIKNDFTLDAQ